MAESGSDRRTIPRREFDLKWAVRRYFYPAIAVYFLLMFLVVVGLHGVSHLVDVLAGSMAIGFIVGVGVLGLATRTIRRQSDASDMGYNAQQGTKPLFVLGRREYERYRVDDGSSEAEVDAQSAFRDALAYRVRAQRGMECRVCQTTIGRDGGYFVEHRTLWRICGVPVRERIQETEAYCAAHKPDGFR